VPRPVVRVVDLDKAYGGRRLFEGAAFQVEEGEHVAVVGPNGAGKTTLLRILAGRERPDHGLLERDERVRTHWFDQHPQVPAEATVRDVLASPTPAPPDLARELSELEARVADPTLYEEPGFEAVLERYADVQQRMKVATSRPGRLEEDPLVLELGVDVHLIDRPFHELSGGQRTRVLLARVLAPVRAGDLVVLDEPTNHLDVETIEWLEYRVQTFDGTLMLVAHDRAFLDAVAERVLEVDHGAITSYPGNYEDYVQLRSQSRDRAKAERERLERETREAQAVVQQFRHQKRFDGQMASRLKVLEKYRAALGRAPDPVIEKHAFDLRFDSGGGSTQVVLSIQGLRKSFGSRMVLDRADLELAKGDRVGLAGPNGSGKSTLLKILSGKLPKDDGIVRIPPGVKGAYYSQERDDLDVNRTLREELLLVRPKMEDDDVKALLGRFRFQPGPDLHRRVGTLSGGERARMALLKTVLKPANLLLLDEPTNHLDLESREVLAHALNAYKGTMLVVSHDRWLLDSVTSKTAILDRGQVRLLGGSFTETRVESAAARPLEVRRDKYRVTKAFKDVTTGEKYAYGREVELTPEEAESMDVFRRALRFGHLERVG
jgi:ATP-binding cassette, subfamily F, member 3